MTLFTLLRLAVALGGYAYCCGEECHAQQPTPAHTITRGADGLERVGVDFNTTTCMQQAAPSCYVVSVRQTGEGASTITWPKVTLAEKGSCIVTAVSQDIKGVPHKWVMGLAHCGTEKGVARFEMRLCGGQHTYSAHQKVTIGQEATVALGGNTPEPLCVGLRVERQAAPSAVACNVPVPPTAALTAATPATWATPVNYPAGYQMPAPMPVAVPVPVVKPMPAPMPVPPPMTAPFNPAPYQNFDKWHAVYPMPPTPMVYPQPFVVPPTNVWHPPPPMVVPVTHTAPVMTKTVSLVKEDGRSKVMMGGVKAVKMSVEEGVCGKMHLCAGAKHVHVSGHAWKAQADKVEVSADGRVVLHGHVKLSCEKLGEGVSVSGDKVCFRVKGGHFVELMAK